MKRRIEDALLGDSVELFNRKIASLLRAKEREAGVRPVEDIAEFHEKFGLEPTSRGDHALDPEMTRFRIKFMLEELVEYCRATGHEMVLERDGQVDVRPIDGGEWSPTEAFDGLIDLVYVALGTAYLHGFPFEKGWARVHGANMKKVWVERPEDSKRGSRFDVVKPAGWRPPVLSDLLRKEAV